MNKEADEVQGQIGESTPMEEVAFQFDAGPSQTFSLIEKTQTEQAILDRLAKATLEQGDQEHWIEVINLYVALKSKPMAILHGPTNGGKDTAIRLIAQLLTDGELLRYQPMTAHARWASNNSNVALFTEAQTRLNSSKLLALIEEALQPENAHFVYVAHLQGLTPAELLGFFVDIAPQVTNGRLISLPCLDLAVPIPYPSNLLLTGTMEMAPFTWCEPDQIAHAVVIPWFGGPMASPTQHLTIDQPCIGRQFLASRVRTRRAACRKLLHLKASVARAMRVLHQMEQVLSRNEVNLPSSAADDVLIYLANAWSDDGIGLFDNDPENNLQTALDLAVSQNMLPYTLTELAANPSLPRQIVRILQPELPRSAIWITNLS